MLSYAGFNRRHYAGEAAVVAAEEKVENMKAKEAAKEAAQRELTLALANKGSAVGTAGLMGLYQGTKGRIPEVYGVGADLIIGAVASAVGLMGHKVPKLKSQKLALEVIDGIGTGSLAFWAANQGNMMGIAKAAKAPAAGAPATKTAGYEGDPRQFAPHFDANVSVEESSTVPYGYR